MDPSAVPPSQANVEYFYRLLYECLHGGQGCLWHIDLSGLDALFAMLWLWIIALGYLLAIVAFFIIIYCTVRLFELRKREEEYYGTLLLAPDAESGGHPRWSEIERLRDSSNASDWRTAIIEADILLADSLAQAGYTGETLADQLKLIDHRKMETLQDAWDAHKVRNQIAHEGSSFDLTETLARRTLARYENVFRELKVVQ